MNEQLFILCQDDLGNYEIRYDDKVFHFLWEVAPILNEQQAIIQLLQKDIIEMSDSHQSYIEMESETKSKVNDIIRTQRMEIRKLSKENEQLKLKIDGLAYALTYIKRIDVEIDLNE